MESVFRQFLLCWQSWLNLCQQQQLIAAVSPNQLARNFLTRLCYLILQFKEICHLSFEFLFYAWLTPTSLWRPNNQCAKPSIHMPCIHMTYFWRSVWLWSGDVLLLMGVDCKGLFQAQMPETRETLAPRRTREEKWKRSAMQANWNEKKNKPFWFLISKVTRYWWLFQRQNGEAEGHNRHYEDQKYCTGNYILVISRVQNRKSSQEFHPGLSNSNQRARVVFLDCLAAMSAIVFLFCETITLIITPNKLFELTC